MIISWKRMIVAMVLANILSQTALYFLGTVAALVVAVMGGLLLGIASQVTARPHGSTEAKRRREQ